MIRIIDGRGSGKTSQLMLLAKENNAVFVCSNPRAMEYKAKAYGIEGIRFISYGEFLTEPTLSRKGNYVIDELEHFVMDSFFTGLNNDMVAYTLTKED